MSPAVRAPPQRGWYPNALGAPTVVSPPPLPSEDTRDHCLSRVPSRVLTLGGQPGGRGDHAAVCMETWAGACGAEVEGGGFRVDVPHPGLCQLRPCATGLRTLGPE